MLESLNGKQMIFIIGCPRSGTSILGEIFRQHADVLYLGESCQEVWNYPSEVRPNHNRDASHAKSSIRWIIDKWLPSKMDEAAQSGGGSRDSSFIVDKCPPNSLRISFLRALLPEARFIHLVRDGRDVACSLAPGLIDDNWSFAQPKGWQDASMRYYDHPALKGAWLWGEIIKTVSNSPALGSEMFATLLYEDLVKDPKRITSLLLQWVELPESEDVVKWAKDNVSNSLKEGYIPDNQAHWMTDDHARRIGRYAENLTVWEQVEIEKMIKDELLIYGYREGGVCPLKWCHYLIQTEGVDTHT